MGSTKNGKVKVKGGTKKAATKARVQVSVFAAGVKEAENLSKPRVIKFASADEAHSAAYAYWGARRRAGLSKVVGVSLDQDSHTVTIGPKGLVKANPKAVKPAKAKVVQTTRGSRKPAERKAKAS
jgi:hypothetical protein